MWMLFAAGLVGSAGTKHLVHGTNHQHLVIVGAIARTAPAIKP